MKLLLLSFCLVVHFAMMTPAVRTVFGQIGSEETRSLSIATSYASQGLPTYFPIVLDSLGNERSLNFSINWDPALLRYVRVDLGPGAPPDSIINLNAIQAYRGQLGISMVSNGLFSAGRRTILYLIVIPPSQSFGTAISVDFSDYPLARSTIGISGESLSTSYVGARPFLGIADPFMIVSAGSLSINRGQTAAIPIRFGPAYGGFLGTTSISFSLQWDPAIFDYDSVLPGAVVPPGSNLELNTTMIDEGRLGVSLGGPNRYFDSVFYHLVTLNLTPKMASPPGSYAVSFNNKPTAFRSSDTLGNPTYAAWIPGFLDLALSTVSGSLRTPGGTALRNTQVTLTDSLGGRSTKMTGSFGDFVFQNVGHGSGYVLSVKSKRYRFAPRVLDVAGNVANIVLSGIE